ncbi:NTP/NDP exchange transporter [Flagellimonas pacifica]|nr:MFS transporter [Allomuricauda parva]
MRKNLFSEKLNHLKSRQLKIVACSAIYFFCLLCSYFILRPLRDEMGIVNGAINMQWLFTGTFLAMLCIVPIFGLLVAKNSIKRVLLFSYSFCIGNILLFYFLFKLFGATRSIAISFFIWLSVFNLFVVSLFWSFMADVFSSKSSKRYFGIIASGGSLGALTGPIIANRLNSLFSISSLLLAAAFFLIIALFCILVIFKLSNKQAHFNKDSENIKFNSKVLFEGIKKIIKSAYLLGIVGFILLYTSISTVLYFEQAHILEKTLTNSNQRISYFSNIDFTVNAIAIMGQFFFTGRIIKKLGLSIVLASVPLLMGFGLIVLGLHQSLITIAILLVLHRAGNFMLLRPGREILFTVSSIDEKYKAKNFIDTAVYRGGDALVGWIFAGLFTLGLSLGTIAFLAAPAALLWSYAGRKLGKQQQQKENILTLNESIYEHNAQ